MKYTLKFDENAAGQFKALAARVGLTHLSTIRHAVTTLDTLTQAETQGVKFVAVHPDGRQEGVSLLASNYKPAPAPQS
jgi:hypothetical protein